MIMVRKLPTLGDNAWLSVVKISIVTGMIIGMVMSLHLWIGERLLPSIPVIKIAPPQGTGITLVIIFITALLATCFSKRREAPAVVIFSATALIFLDQLRLQPWVYLYLLLLIPFAFGSGDRTTVSSFYLIVIAGIYIWSGVHKINIHFLDGNYASNLEFVLGYKIKNDADVIRSLGYGVGLVEMSVGVSLLFDLTRRVAIFGVILMHLLIITFVVFHRAVSDSIVIPWNLTMIVLNVATFYPLRSPFEILRSERLKDKFATGFAVLLVWICPALNFVGLWDHFPSFSLYSNKVSMFYVAIHEDEVHKIDQRLTKYFVAIPGLQGGHLLDIHWWSEDELNVPFYPEKRAFRELSSYFCGLGIPEDRIVFLELESGDSKAPVINSFRCTTSGQ